MKLTFRHATPADIALLVDLVTSAYRGDASRAGWTTEADLLDGLRISDASGLGVDLNQMDVSSVERLEVISGPASSLYGSDAHGGVMALYSPGSAPEGFSGSLAGTFGTRGRGAGSFAPAYGWKGGWVRASLRAEGLCRVLCLGGSTTAMGGADSYPSQLEGMFL